MTNTPNITPLESSALAAAFRGNGDAERWHCDSRRIRTRTLNSLTAKGLLYSQGIEGDRSLTPAGAKLAASLICAKAVQS